MIKLSVHHLQYHQYEVWHPRAWINSCTVFIVSWKQTASKCHLVEFLAMPETHACVSSWRFLAGGWHNHIHLPISSQTCFMGDKSGDQAGLSRTHTFSKAFLVWTAVWAFSYWNIPFITLVMKDMTTWFTNLATYWRAFSFPSTGSKSVLFSPHHDSRSWRGLPLDNCLFLWPFIRSLWTRWHLSDCHKQKRDSSLNTTECHSVSQLTLALHQRSSTFWVWGPIYIFHIILWAAVIADYKIIMDILNIIIGAWTARQVT